MKMGDLVSAAKASARVQGCDCDVEVEVPNREERRALLGQYGEHEMVHHLKLMHDPWCSLYNRIQGPGNN